MKHTKRLLEQRGLLIYWRFPFLCKDISKKDWKNITYESIETVEENRRHQYLPLNFDGIPKLPSYKELGPPIT